MLAPTVEQKFTKDKIMEFYCNSNYYGNRCYGVGQRVNIILGNQQQISSRMRQQF